MGCPENGHSHVHDAHGNAKRPEDCHDRRLGMDVMPPPHSGPWGAGTRRSAPHSGPMRGGGSDEEHLKGDSCCASALVIVVMAFK